MNRTYTTIEEARTAAQDESWKEANKIIQILKEDEFTSFHTITKQIQLNIG